MEKTEEMLVDAEFLHERGRLGSAADRAYYAMFHATQAALAAFDKKAPRSHRGLRSQFGEHLVTTGLIERAYSRDLTKAHQVRQESTYEAYAATTEDEVGDLVGRAERFVARIRALVGERA